MRDLGRALEPLDRRGGEAGGLVVRRDLGAHRVEVRGVEQLERLGDPPVEQPSPARADARIRGVADPVMAEVVGVEALLADDLALPQLVERPDQAGLLELARLFEDLEREGATDRGGDLERLRRFLGQLVETRPDRGQDPRRQPADRRVARPRGRSRVASPPRATSMTYSGWPSVSR